MALSFSAAKANIKRNYYLVYMRETGTAIAAADYDTLAHWTTFLALFTYIGYCENKAVKVDVVPNDPVDIDLGEEKFLGYEGTTDIKFLQSAVADDTALADMASKDCDMLLVSNGSLKFRYVHNKRFNVETHINSGDIEHSIIKHKQNVTAASGSSGYIHTTGAIPTS